MADRSAALKAGWSHLRFPGDAPYTRRLTGGTVCVDGGFNIMA
jgi:environmental stress-induced protein Ves